MPIFGAQLFLLAGLAAVIPVALHLLHRRRPREYPFSTVRFLEQALARTRRSRHITHIVTLLLRVLILLLLALAFARPRIRDISWVPEGRRQVVLVLDRTASMQCRRGEGNVFEAAREWALRVLDSLEPGDRVGLLFVGPGDTEAIMPPVTDHERVRRVLEDALCGFGAADWVEELAAAVTTVARDVDSFGTEIHLFSDFQRTGWQAAGAEGLSASLEARHSTLFLNRVASAGGDDNAGITAGVVRPPAVAAGESFAVTASIRSGAGFEGSNSVGLTVGGQVADSASVVLDPEAALDVELLGQADAGQGVTGVVALNPDVFALDNRFFFALPNAARIPVLVVSGEDTGADTFFLSRALRPRQETGALWAVHTASWSEWGGLALDRYRAVLLANPPTLTAVHAARLDDFAAHGGLVLLFPGDRTDPAGLRNLASLNEIPLVLEFRDRAEPMDLVPCEGASAIQDRIARIVPTIPAVSVTRRLQIRGLPNRAEVLLRFEDSLPLLVSLPAGTGRVWLSALSAERSSSEFPLSPLFVVAVHELLREHVRGQFADLTTWVGQTLSLPLATRGLTADVEVTDPQGAVRVQAISRALDTARFRLGGFLRPGHHEVRMGESVWHVAVNVPAAEGELAAVPRGDLLGPFAAQGTAVFCADWEAQQEILQHRTSGRPLWPLLLALAFLLAIGEELFANLRGIRSGAASATRAAAWKEART